MSWSKLIDTPVGSYVSNLMANESLHYHNFKHVMRLYEIAEQLNIAYDINLDMAILWHDAVYDNQDDKELRSAVLMRDTARDYPEWFEGVNVNTVFSLIMNTYGHIFNSNINPTMIILDLYDLTIPERRKANFENIVKESIALYGITEEDICKNTVDFMNSYAKTMFDNATRDLQNFDMWNDIGSGCIKTKTLAKLRLAELND